MNIFNDFELLYQRIDFLRSKVSTNIDKSIDLINSEKSTPSIIIQEEIQQESFRLITAIAVIRNQQVSHDTYIEDFYIIIQVEADFPIRFPENKGGYQENKVAKSLKKFSGQRRTQFSRVPRRRSALR